MMTSSSSSSSREAFPPRFARFEDSRGFPAFSIESPDRLDPAPPNEVEPADFDIVAISDLGVLAGTTANATAALNLKFRNPGIDSGAALSAFSTGFTQNPIRTAVPSFSMNFMVQIFFGGGPPRANLSNRENSNLPYGGPATVGLRLSTIECSSRLSTALKLKPARSTGARARGFACQSQSVVLTKNSLGFVHDRRSARRN